MNARSWMVGAALAAAMLVGGVTRSGALESKPSASSLEKMGRLVGGYWRIEGGKPLNAYNLFEWGVGKRMVKFSSHLIEEQGTTLRAEGSFMWNPVQKQIVGRTMDAAGSLYDGVFNTDGEIWTHDFTYFTANGPVQFHETWEFPNHDTYVWTLFQKTESGNKQAIQTTFRRVQERPKS